MNLAGLIAYLRRSVYVDQPNVANDTEFIALSDTEIQSIIEVSLTRDNPHVDINNIPSVLLYPIVLLSKKELFYQLATKNSPLYSIGFGDTAIRKNERFNHYMDLIRQIELEYQKYLDNGMPILVGNMFLASKYFSQRNYDYAEPPKVEIQIDNVYSNMVEISWNVLAVDRFSSFLIYRSPSKIVDEYDGFRINEQALQIAKITDIHNTRYRITCLTPNTSYYIGVIIQAMNGLKSISEKIITTLLV